MPGDVPCDPGVVYPEELHVFSGLNNRGCHDGGRHVEIAKAVGYTEAKLNKLLKNKESLRVNK